MENTQTQLRVSGAFLILMFLSLASVASSIFLSGYLAIGLGVLALGLAYVTKEPLERKQRIIVYFSATAGVLLGIGAQSLGIIAALLIRMK